MLDMIEKETKYTMLEVLNTTTPVAKYADEEDANKNNVIQTKTTIKETTTNSSPKKAKTIFNWFRSGGTTKQTNKIDVDVKQTNRQLTGCRTKSLSPTAKQPTTPLTAYERDVTLREFRGVQSLRHLWNKRISSANEDANRRQSSLSDSKKSKLTKSIGCLVHATGSGETYNCTNATSDINDGLNLRQKRAHSLHDCTQVGVISTRTAEIDNLHRVKDNFYKYKTAEQAAKHLAREGRVRNKTQRRVTAGIVCSDGPEGDAYFPAVKTTERGERIHWLKRQDMMGRRLECIDKTHTDCQTKKISTSMEALSVDDVVINETLPNNNVCAAITTMAKTTELLPISPVSTGQSPAYYSPSNSSDNSEMLSANSTPCHTAVSRKRSAQSETSNTTATVAKRSSSDSCKSKNLNTLSTSVSTTNVTNSAGRSARRTASSASTSSSISARKYSFKTHARTYHAPRKMSQRDRGGGATGGTGGSATTFVPTGGNIVAKLTQQFNEMIQKDKNLLEEVKRKNGVLISRGGHVYKVVENPLAQTTDTACKHISPCISRCGSHGRKDGITAPTFMRAASSTVQRNIKKFENVRSDVKPVVPVKSEQVLQKLRELNKQTQPGFINSSGEGSVGGLKRFHLRHTQAGVPTELQSKLESKKAQLSLPLSPPLEVVKEESKTPLEAYEKSLGIRQQENNTIDVLAQADVTNATNMENTYKPNENTPKQSELICNDALDCGDVQLLTPLSNINNVVSDAKTSVGQLTVKEENTNDTETKTICIAAATTTASSSNEAIKIDAEKNNERAESNANVAELSVVMNAMRLDENVERSKTNNTIETATKKPKMTASPLLLKGTTKKLINTNNDTNEDELDAINDEKSKQRKHKYAKIYEKFRFRSPFAGGGQSNKKLSPAKQQTAIVMEKNEEEKRTKTNLIQDTVERLETETKTREKEFTTNQTKFSNAAVEHKEMDKISNVEPESKLLDALELIDHRLKELTDDRDSEDEGNTAALLLSPDEDFEQRVLPNNSFIFQARTKQVANNKLIVAQAVNVTLVNSIEGEQLVLEQKELLRQKCDYSEMVRPLSISLEQQVLMELEHRNKAEQSESGKEFEHRKQAEQSTNGDPIYEPINILTKEKKTEETTTIITNYNMSTKNAENTSTESEDSKRLAKNLDENIYVEHEIFEDIYQTVDEVKTQTAQPPIEATNKAFIADYESIAGSCEHTTPASVATVALDNTVKPLYDGYEICEPLVGKFTGSIIALPSIDGAACSTSITTPKLLQQTSMGGGNIRNTNDELPELPKPKRRLPKSPMPNKRSPKNHQRNSLSTTRTTTGGSNITLTALDDHEDDDHHYYADDENIYDTIKSSTHCYESVNAANVALQKSASTSTKCGSDSISVISNGYESISHYRRASHSGTSVSGGGGVAGGYQMGSSRGGSSLTISSDHKTNSLYEMSVTASMIYNMGSRQLSRKGSSDVGRLNNNGGLGVATANNASDMNSDSSGGFKHYYQTHIGAASDNSDEWVDLSDAEIEGAAKAMKPQFIIVRERSKAHRSPDWSKRVRDKRLHQKKAISCIEDDSDHYYETLAPLGNKRHSTLPVQRTVSHDKRSQDLPHFAKNGAQSSKQYSASMYGLGTLATSDDYDSFDTDTDDIYEAEENIKNTDSGVDIRNVKLPDPPPPTNQVYAIVRKLKNFISNKRSPGSHSKYGGSQQKLYENSTQFYVSGTNNIYENTPNTKSKIQKNVKKPAESPQDQDAYENTEFHSPLALTSDVDKQVNSTDKSINSPTDTKTAADTSNSNATLRNKSNKSSKSFKSRLRKSLVGSTFDMKQLTTTLPPARSTFYIEDPTNGGSGELDSGFSEKASSGDLPIVPTATPTAEAHKFSTVARKAKKEAKASNSQRRKTTIGIRPQDPPPPPPVASSTTSWYAECGVFKNGSNGVLEESEISLNDSKGSQSGSSGMNGNSWYTEAGLYQTSGISVASSSGSSGVSTGNEGALGDDLSHSMFQNEPLYQIYSAAKLESIKRDIEGHDSSTDGYEEIGQNEKTEKEKLKSSQRHQRPSAFQLIEPKNGPSRTLWSEITEVINSCVLATLTPRERSLQEAKFEIITSEASHLKSLNLLRSHFMNHPIFRDTNVVCARDRKALFAYIVPVHECSERLLTEMESCWQDNIMLIGLSKRIYNVAEKYFHVYIAFCEHQGRMDRTLRRLKESRGIFSQNLHLLETSSTCCGLNLHSFLMLPMQRITRLPLLIDAVFSKVSPNDDEYESWKMTLAIMNKIVTQCNEAANRCEQAYEIERIARQLEFPSTIRALAIAPVGVSAPGSKPRFLVKRGELTQFIWRGDDVKLTFGKKFSKVSIYVFLFSDLLVLTKRKGEEQFTVFDYCPRSMLTITSGDLRDISQTHKNLILMTLLENHERKTVELLLSCPSVSEQERWLQAVRPPEPETPGEKLYAPWDCPQVIVKHEYATREPDALSLEVGDVVNVTRKLPDGWYQGERIRDGVIGWFPGSYTEEVNSAHVRARNLKQRQRLLTFTASYLESQKRK